MKVTQVSHTVDCSSIINPFTLESYRKHAIWAMQLFGPQTLQEKAPDIVKFLRHDSDDKHPMDFAFKWKIFDWHAIGNPRTLYLHELDKSRCVFLEGVTGSNEYAWLIENQNFRFDASGGVTALHMYKNIAPSNSVLMIYHGFDAEVYNKMKVKHGTVQKVPARTAASATVDTTTTNPQPSDSSDIDDPTTVHSKPAMTNMHSRNMVPCKFCGLMKLRNNTGRVRRHDCDQIREKALQNDNIEERARQVGFGNLDWQPPIVGYPIAYQMELNPTHILDLQEAQQSTTMLRGGMMLFSSPFYVDEADAPDVFEHRAPSYISPSVGFI